MAKLPPFDLCELKRRLSYCPATGRLTWLVSPSNNVPVASVAGVKLRTGYRKVTVNNYQMHEHHVAWFLHHGEWPTMQIDHINGARDDNRAANLRLATQSQQNFNTLPSRVNTSGVKGVSWCGRNNNWRAYITLNRKQHHLGNFASKEKAMAARASAESRVCGEFQRQSEATP